MPFLVTSIKFQARDNTTGVAAPGALVYSYLAGTLTATPTYTSQSGGTPNTNPVVCDAAGKADIWVGAVATRLIVKTAGGVTLEDTDNIPGGAQSFAALTTTGDTVLGDATTDTLNVGAGGIVKDANGDTTIAGKLICTGPNVAPTLGASNMYMGLSSTYPSFGLVNAVGGLNSKTWEFYADTTSMHFRVSNDAYTLDTNWLIVIRSGITITSVTFPQGDFVTTPPATPPTLTVNGTFVMNMTSNTNCRLSYRGSDGVTRVLNLTPFA